MSKDHKPDLDAEKERIIKAGGYIQFGRVNGTLNLARAIGTFACSFFFIFFCRAVEEKIDQKHSYYCSF